MAYRARVCAFATSGNGLRIGEKGRKEKSFSSGALLLHKASKRLVPSLPEKAGKMEKKFSLPSMHFVTFDFSSRAEG